MRTTLLWLRRDLRLDDHPAALTASGRETAGPDASGQVGPGRPDATVTALFVLDPALWQPSGDVRRVWLARSLAALDASLRDRGGRLVIRHGDPAEVVPALARELGAEQVHVTADAGPYGRRRDAAVARALQAQDGRLVATGTPYAIGPGTLHTGAGRPFQVFTPFRTAWLAHGWPGPATVGRRVRWRADVDSEPLPAVPACDVALPDAGEAAARRRWEEFRDEGLDDYADRRDLPAVTGTSQLSAHLKFGELHPRTLLADLGARTGPGVEAFRSELCWREFYADVLWHRPDSARDYLRPQFARMRYDDPREDERAARRLRAWTQGRTGFPFVDAGMRQLLAEGWMHNRLRMIVASFLVKHLHLEWQHGARHFMRHLRDGDLASNSHGWQWTAGSGTDAAPYFRVFNPVTQGVRFDPDGTYVRRHLPELAHLPGAAAHRPWDAADGYAHGYPDRIVDLAAEREEALARLAELRRDGGQEVPR